MNKVILLGRATADPEIYYGTGENPLAIGRYTLAVRRRFAKEGEQDTDFIRCVAFGKAAEFAERWIQKGGSNRTYSDGQLYQPRRCQGLYNGGSDRGSRICRVQEKRWTGNCRRRS